MTREEINYLDIVPTKCDCCGKMVGGYYSKSGQWWDKYIEPSEENICLGCIAGRANFREEYQRLFGISVDEGIKLYGK